MFKSEDANMKVIGEKAISFAKALVDKDIEQLKKQLDQMEKKIDGLNKKLDTHIDKIWQVYEGLRNPIKAVSKMFKK